MQALNGKYTNVHVNLHDTQHNVNKGGNSDADTISSEDDIRNITKSYYNHPSSSRLESFIEKKSFVPPIDHNPTVDNSVERIKESTDILAELITDKLSNSGVVVKTRYIAKKPNEITVVPGDMIGIIETFDNGMAFGINRKSLILIDIYIKDSSGSMGIFPLDCVLEPAPSVHVDNGNDGL